MRKLQLLIDDGGEKGEGFFDDEEENSDGGGPCSLSPLQRMYAFAASLLAAIACMFLSLIVLAKPIKFALLFTFANVLAVGRASCILSIVILFGSTAFLIGPGQQLRMMFDSTRLYATAVYIASVVICLICALWIHSKILTLVAIICEICALIWYSLSYIPFARRMVSNLMIRFCDTEI